MYDTVLAVVIHIYDLYKFIYLLYVVIHIHNKFTKLHIRIQSIVRFEANTEHRTVYIVYIMYKEKPP